MNDTIAADLVLPFSIFVTDNEDIYVDNGALYGRAEKRRFNMTRVECIQWKSSDPSIRIGHIPVPVWMFWKQWFTGH